MAPSHPIRGGGTGAQVLEYKVDPRTCGSEDPDVPDRLTVELSTDANNTFQITIVPDTGGPRWRLDARVTDESIETMRAFRDGTCVESTPD